MASGLAGLGLVKATLNKLARLPSRASTEAAKEINIELRKQAAAGTDPYGRAHAPLKRPRRSGGSGPPLVDSGASYGQTQARALGGAGLSVRLGDLLVFHMRAGKGRPARRALPVGGFPPAWKAAIERAAKRVAAQAGVR